MHAKGMKNPLCRPGNLSLAIHWEGTDHDQVGDEFCHSHSESLRRKCQRQDKLREDMAFITEFVDFVAPEDSARCPWRCLSLLRRSFRCAWVWFFSDTDNKKD